MLALIPVLYATMAAFAVMPFALVNFITRAVRSRDFKVRSYATTVMRLPVHVGPLGSDEAAS